MNDKQLLNVLKNQIENGQIRVIWVGEPENDVCQIGFATANMDKPFQFEITATLPVEPKEAHVDSCEGRYLRTA